MTEQRQDSPQCFRLPKEVDNAIDSQMHEDGTWGQFRSRTGAVIALVLRGAGWEWQRIVEVIERHCRTRKED